jgi:regulator of cell morphogenesis and NO signaling
MNEQASTLPPPPIAAATTLAALATAYAGASRVFGRHRLDFCCNGKVTIGDACRRKGLDVELILAELRTELAAEVPETGWDQRPLAELIGHVLDRFHAGHRAELPRLLAMAEKVESVHADKPSCPRGLAAHLRYVAQELEQHMRKEELVLFPMLLAGQGAFAEGPISVMEEEHVEHGRNLARLRQLAHDYAPPPEACGTWRALYLGLAELEHEVMQHISLENHVLFPRASAS